MYSKNFKPTKQEKDWWDYLAQNPCTQCGSCLIQLHHILGSSASHMKVHIGQWAMMPLCPPCHARIDSMDKQEQLRIFFQRVLAPYYERYRALPDGMSGEHVLAMATWHR